EQVPECQRLSAVHGGFSFFARGPPTAGGPAASGLAILRVIITSRRNDEGMPTAIVAGDLCGQYCEHVVSDCSNFPWADERSERRIRAATNEHVRSIPMQPIRRLFTVASILSASVFLLACVTPPAPTPQSTV